MRVKFFLLAICASLFSMLPIGAFASELAQAPKVLLTDQQIARLGITTQIAQPAGDISLANVPAKIIPARSSLRAITVPFEGVLTKIHILPSQKVEAGQTLFTIRSRDYLDMKIGLDAAKSELSTANIALAQQQKLVDEGLAAGATLLPLKAAVMRAQAMVDEHQAPLRGIYSAGGAQYSVKAPAKGRIEAFDLEIGQTVEPLMAVSALYTSDALWAEVQVPADLVGYITAGDKIGFDDGSYGEVVSAARLIDTKTKSALLVAKVPSGSGLNIGQLTSVNISKLADGNELVRVPSSAIIRLNGKTNIYKKSDDGFVPLEVEVKGRTRGFAIIAGAVKPGDVVAASGLTELKAISLMEAE